MRRICLLALSLLLLAGCSPTTVEPTRLVADPTAMPEPTTAIMAPTVSDSAAAAEGGDAYPAPELPTRDSAYPGPQVADQQAEATSTPLTVEIVSEIVVPTPSAGKATVTGVLLYRNEDGDEQPAQYVRVFLARRLRDAEGQPSFMVSMSKSSAPTCITDGVGRFAMGEVDPEYYALIVESDQELALAIDLQTQGEVLISPEADQTVDVGTIILQTQ